VCSAPCIQMISHPPPAESESNSFLAGGGFGSEKDIDRAVGFACNKVAAIRAMRHKGTGIRRIARELGVGVGTVMRVTARV
jgi:hypothetical protein